MRVFTHHPESVGETYAGHLCAASRFGARMIAAGLACLVHGLLPFLFATTGSRTIADLSDQMVRNRGTPNRPPAPGPAGGGRDGVRHGR